MLGVAGGNPTTYKCIPCVRTGYTQGDILQPTGGEKTEERMYFRFLTPCDAPNPTKDDKITDDEGRIWTIVGAASGSVPYNRKWLAYITVPTGQGTGFSRGK